MQRGRHGKAWEGGHTAGDLGSCRPCASLLGHDASALLSVVAEMLKWERCEGLLGHDASALLK
eukprot:1159714-Pelagomonas_calceolata.AAC.10